MRKVGCFDIGGTGCQWAIFYFNKIIDQGAFTTLNKTKNQIIISIANIINTKLSAGDVVGISSPTAINLQTGYAYGISGIQNYGNFNLYDELQAKLDHDIPIKATNDANAALLGTMHFDQSATPNSVMVTIGTGIGGAIILNGQIITGHQGFAGEFGYSHILDKKYNLSQRLSTAALIRMVKAETNDQKTGQEIIEAFLKRNKYAKIVHNWMNGIAQFLATIVYFLNVETIYLGGGISNNHSLIEAISAMVYQELLSYQISEIMPHIKAAYKGADAGLYGALTL